MVLNLFVYYNENPFYYIQTISYFSFKLLKKVFRWRCALKVCKKLDSLFWRLLFTFFVSRKLSGKRKFSKDNFLPFLIAVLLWCNIVVVLWYKLNKESFSFYIFIGFAPAFISYFQTVQFSVTRIQRRGNVYYTRPIAKTCGNPLRVGRK